MYRSSISYKTFVHYSFLSWKVSNPRFCSNFSFYIHSSMAHAIYIIRLIFLSTFDLISLCGLPDYSSFFFNVKIFVSSISAFFTAVGDKILQPLSTYLQRGIFISQVEQGIFYHNSEVRQVSFYTCVWTVLHLMLKLVDIAWCNL